jgi:hypothetical protein
MRSNPDRFQQPNAGATQLIRILESDAAYLVWSMRCERTIRRPDRTEREVELKPTAEDRQQEIIRGYDHSNVSATKKRLHKIIENTWEKALHKHHGSIQENWMLYVEERVFSHLSCR